MTLMTAFARVGCRCTKVVVVVTGRAVTMALIEGGAAGDEGRDEGGGSGSWFRSALTILKVTVRASCTCLLRNAVRRVAVEADFSGRASRPRLAAMM